MTNQERTEVDMGYVQGFVNLIAQALVAATELPKQIENMQADLTALHGNLEQTKARNIELDTLLGDTRRQRDEAEHALSQVKANIGQLQSDLANARNGWDQAAEKISSLQASLDQAKKERDDYGLKHMAAEDRASEAEGKLKKLREALGMPEEAPKPVPVAEPVNVMPEKPTEYGSTPTYPATTPTEAIPAPTKVYEGQAGFNDLPYSTEAWDNTAQRYYRTA